MSNQSNRMINVTLKLQTIADIKDVVTNAQEIEKVFSKIKVPENLQPTFKRIFENITKQGEKASQALSSGFKTKGDVSNFKKTTQDLNTSINELYNTAKKLKAENFNLNTDSIVEFNNQIKEIQKSIADLPLKNLERINEIINDHPGKAQSWANFLAAFKDGNFSEAQTALEKLETQVAKAQQRLGEDFGGNENWVKYSGYVSELRDILNQTITDADAFQTKINNLEIDRDTFGAEAAKQAESDYNAVLLALQKFGFGYQDLRAKAEETAEGQRHLNSELDNFKSKIEYFFGAQNAVNLFKRAIRSAYETVKDLDAVMTETAVVTDFSVGDMWSQLPEYTQRANELGVSIHSAYEAATIYYQQGLKTNEVMAVSNATLKMARIAGLEAAEATDRMTNALRGFNMEITEANANNIADVYSKLAAISASDVDEISTAMTKTASLAASANMEFETTAAFLAQIIETTRESAETAGTALKTVIARFSEVKKLYSEGELLGTDEEGQEIDVNKVSAALRVAGINLNEFLTGSKGLDEVFLELASKWDDLTIVQQRYIATMAAGSRQQSRFIALMSDYARTQELVEAATNANGASQEQYEKTLESLQTKLTKLKNAWDEFTMGISNNKLIKQAVDLITEILQLLNKVSSSFGDTGGGIVKLTMAIGGFLALKPLLNAILQSFLQAAGGADGFAAKLIGASERGQVALDELSAKAEKLPASFNKANKAVLALSATFGIASIALSTYAKHLRENDEEEKAEKVEALASSFGLLGGVLAIVGPLLSSLGLGPVGIAITALVGAVVACGNAFGWFDSEAKKAEKRLEAAKKKAKQAQEEYDALNNSLKNIKDQSDTLKTLTKYTDEWNEAVQSLNQSVLELLANYPELAQYIRMNDEGVFEFTDEKGVKNVLNQKYDDSIRTKADEARTAYENTKTSAADTIKDIRGTFDVNDLIKKAYEEFSYKGQQKTNLETAIINAIGDLDITSDTFAEDLKKAVVAQLDERERLSAEATLNFDQLKIDEWAKIQSAVLVEQNKLSAAQKTYSQQLLAYSKSLSSINLDKELIPYYNRFEGTAYSRQLIEEGASVDEYQERAQLFTELAAKNSGMQSLLNPSLTVDELSKLTGEDYYHYMIGETNLRNFVSKADWDNFLAPLIGARDKIQDALSGYKGISAGDFELDTADYLQQVHNELGQGTIQANVIRAAAQIAPENQKEFLQAFSSLNIHSISAIQDFPQLLEELGIDTSKASDGINKIVEDLLKLESVTKQISFDNVNSLLEELSGRKSNERTWSQEQYNQWRDLGVTEGWVQTGEDQYTYTGSQSTMQQALQVSASTQGTGLSYNKYAGETDWATLNAAQAEDADAISRITGEAAAYEEAQDELEAYNKALAENGDRQKALRELQFATNVAKWNEKLEDLRSTLDDDFDGLENVEKGTDAYNERLAQMSTHLNEVFGYNLSGEFLQDQEALDLLTQAMDGDIEAWEDFLLKMDQAQIDADLSSGRLAELGYTAQDTNNLVAALDGLDFDINGNANMNQVIQALLDAGMTADSVARYLEDLSYTNIEFQVEETENGLRLRGDASATKLPVFSGYNTNTFGGGGGSSGGGGGGKNDVWENPYDELYNLVEKVNEALRQREKLERAYDRILKDRDATVDQIKQNSLDEIANLHKEIDLQRQLLDGRRQQLAMVGSETYKDSEGNFKTYEEMGVTRYASYNEQTGLLQIDWEGIDQIIDTEIGGAVEAYISRLEELQDEIESAHETMEDMGDQIREIKERNIKNYLEFEDRVYQAIVDREQKTIDEYSRLADQIEDSNSRTLEALRESIDLERQIRDNTKEEEDIADKEARLAYLSRDTSGANNLEILQLQKDIEEARENYQDKMIDQAIDQMSKDNDLAAQQREDQLNVMQAQLDWDKEHGAFWDETAALIQGSFDDNGMLKDGSPLVTLLKESDAFKGMSDFGKEQWIRDLVTEWLQAQEGLSQAIIKNAERSGSLTLDNGTKLSYNKTTGRWTDKSGNEYENVTWDVQKQTFTGTNVGKPKTTTTVNGPTTKSGAGTTTGGSPGGIYTNDPNKESENRTIKIDTSGPDNGYVHSEYNLNADTGKRTVHYTPTGTERVGLSEDILSEPYIVGYELVNEKYHRVKYSNGKYKQMPHVFNLNGHCVCGYKKTQISQLVYGEQYNRFATGGLADFTGPAWLDGSKSHPELVLSPKDTENFITLKNHLAKVSEGSGLGGDNYYDIDINVDEISSDYDVDKMADRIKDRIYSDSAYRNVNTINFIH